MRPILARLAPLPLILALLSGGCAQHDRQSPPSPEQTATAPTPTASESNAEALERLQRQAQRGDTDSQFQLGSFYFVGNPAATQRRDPAANGNTAAPAATPKNLQQAEYWWRQAANRGHAEAAVSLAYLYTGRDNPEYSNHREMLKYLNQSASGGNPMAQHILASFYLRGIEGLPRDPEQARRLYHSACRQNYTASCKALNSLPRGG
jgi:TPR repeat protein